MQVKFVSCLVVLTLAGAVWANPVGSFDETTGTLTYDIATPATETQAFSDYGTVMKVVKKGSGELILSASNGTWAGEVSVEAGVLHDKAPRTADDYCTGVGKASAVRVSGGGQFKSTQSFGWNRQGLDNYPGVTFYIEGEGPDGKGALYGAISGPGDHLFPNVVMTGPATVGGTRGVLGGTLDMGGFTLTNKCSDGMFTRQTVKNHGTWVEVGSLCFENGNDLILPAGGDQKFILAPGASVNFYNNNRTYTYPIVVEKNGKWAVGGASSDLAYTKTTYNNWKGPVEICAGGTLTFGGNGSNVGTYSFWGPISGPGAVAVDTSTKAARIYLRGTNTWSGGTSIAGNELWGIVDGSISTNGPITSTGGAIQLVTTTATGWTMPHAHDVYYRHTGSGYVSFYTDEGKTATDDQDFPTGNGPLRHDGLGTLVTTGRLGSPEKPFEFYNNDGTWRFTGCGNGSRNYLKAIRARKGTVEFADAGYFWTTNSTWSFGDAETPRIVLSGATTIDGCVPNGSGGSAYTEVSIGGNSAGQRGVVEVTDGAGFTNRTQIGKTAKTVGALYVSGAKSALKVASNANADTYIGQNGYGTLIVEDGNVALGHALKVGQEPASTGVVEFRGGKIQRLGSFTPSAGGTGVVYVTGAQLSAAGTDAMTLGSYDWSAAAKYAGRGVVTIDGPTALVEGAGVLNLGQRTNNFVAVMNVKNGGVLSTGVIRKNDYSSQYKVTFPDTSKVGAYLNFDGGTFRARANGDVFEVARTTQKITKTTVYAGGATIDANGYSVNVNLPLEKPDGYGVASITIPANASLTNYLGSQVVAISGGAAGRVEATALALVDQATRRLTRVVVMSPGQGYQEGDVVTATIPNANYNGANPTAFEVTLAPLVSGGLTVTNSSATAGTVTLSAANTYTGPTVVAAGTLKVAAAGALPENSAITVVAGKGTLDVTGYGLPAGATLTVDGRALNQSPAARKDRHQTLVKGLTAAPTVTGSLPYPWATTYRNGELTVDYKAGLVIFAK